MNRPRNAHTLLALTFLKVLFATEAATIRVSPENRKALGLKWVKTY